MRKIIITVIVFVVIAIIVLDISFTGKIAIQWATPWQMLRSIITCAILVWTLYWIRKSEKNQQKGE